MQRTHIFGLLSLAAALSGCSHSETIPFPAKQTTAPQSAGSLASSPGWQPDPVSIAQLTPEVPLKEFAIRPPQGYEPFDASLLKALLPDGLDFYVWHNARDVSSASLLAVMVIRRVPTETPTDILNKIVNSENARYGAEFVRNQSETGNINGIPFARVHWLRMEKSESGDRVTSGFTYATVTDSKGIFIEGADIQPCASQPCYYRPSGISPVPMLEAAAMTFHQP